MRSSGEGSGSILEELKDRKELAKLAIDMMLDLHELVEEYRNTELT